MSLSKKEKFVCEMIWGGILVDIDFVRNSSLFKDGLNRFEKNEFRKFWEDEIWKDVIGYEGLYQISSFGRLKSYPRNGTIKAEKILKCCFDSDGYVQYVLSKGNRFKSVKGHQLVASHFIDNPNSLPIPNHIDCNRTNNCYWNLEWVTHAENTFHGLSQKGIHDIGIHKRNDSGKYRARITKNGNRINLGTFVKIEDAKMAIISFRERHNMKNRYSNI